MLWIAYAPITGPAAAFYGISDLKIGLLAIIFMMAFIPLSIPVSWAIDTYGFQLTVSIGAVLMGVFGVVRGLEDEKSSPAALSGPAIQLLYPLSHIPHLEISRRGNYGVSLGNGTL
ncbi:MAG TPA: hypothetical protein VII97_04000 [Anaerolineales bacterium]